MHSEYGLGISEGTSSLKIFKPVFIDFRLPYEAIRLEEFTIIGTVFNYHSEAVTLDLDLKLDNSFVIGKSCEKYGADDEVCAD